MFKKPNNNSKAPNDDEWVKGLKSKNININIAIKYVANKNLKHKVILLLTHGASINQAVLGAANGGHVSLIEYLITQNPNIHLQEAAESAALNGHLDLVKYLLTKGVLITSEMVRYAARRGHMSLIRYFISQQSDINLQEAAESAASGGHTSLVEYLIPKVLDLNTVVMIAAAHRHASLVNYLITQGAELNIDEAVFWAASLCNNTANAECLLLKGASIDQAISGSKSMSRKTRANIFLSIKSIMEECSVNYKLAKACLVLKDELALEPHQSMLRIRQLKVEQNLTLNQSLIYLKANMNIIVISKNFLQDIIHITNLPIELIVNIFTYLFHASISDTQEVIRAAQDRLDKCLIKDSGCLTFFKVVDIPSIIAVSETSQNILTNP